VKLVVETSWYETGLLLVLIALPSKFAVYDKSPQRLWLIGYVTIEKADCAQVLAVEETM
jgi:hypothetical protein